MHRTRALGALETRAGDFRPEGQGHLQLFIHSCELEIVQYLYAIDTVPRTFDETAESSYGRPVQKDNGLILARPAGDEPMRKGSMIELQKRTYVRIYTTADGVRINAMNVVENTFQEFVDAVHTAGDATAFERVAARAAQKLGFQRFAYLRLTGDTPLLISSYPKSWTSRYFHLGYQQLDPVVLRARVERDLFSWGGASRAPAGNREQRQFFDEATTFGLRSGITVPIRGGFGRIATFTLATSDRDINLDRFVGEWRDVVHQVGLYFHVHVASRLDAAFVAPQLPGSELTQRERQCLAWTAQGKTVADIAVLVAITPRTVVFHLENARRKLGAASIAQCVAVALRRGLLT